MSVTDYHSINSKLYRDTKKLSSNFNDILEEYNKLLQGNYGKYSQAQEFGERLKALQAESKANRSKYGDYVEGSYFDDFDSEVQRIYDDYISKYARGAEDYQTDIDRLTSERDKINQQYTAAAGTISGKKRSGQYSQEEMKQDEEKLNSLKKQLDDLDRQIESNKAGQWGAKNSEKYGAYAGKADFSKNSKVTEDDRTAVFGLNIGDKWLGFGDPTYDYINNLDDEQKAYEIRNEGSDNQGLYKYSFMSDREISTYNYLYNTEGKKAANDYLKALGNELDGRRVEQLKADNAEYATEHPWIASAYSIPTNLISGVGYLGVAGQNAIKGIKETITGEYAGPINYNGAAMNPNAASSSIRGTVAQNLADEYGVIEIDAEEHPFLSRVLNGKSLGDVYQLGMSMADSTATLALSPIIGSAGTVLLGGSAATQGMLDAVANGATDSQALTLGIVNGVAEWGFEKVGMDNFMNKIIKGDKAGLVKALLSQGLAEGGEELGTSMVNTIADHLIMAEKSGYSQAIAEYVKQGYSEEKAAKMALQDIAISMGWDFFGGMVSGGIMGGGGYALTTAPSAIKEGFTARKEIKADKVLIANAAAERLTELGETGDVKAISTVLAKQAAGNKLNADDQRILNDSKYGTRVLNELQPHNIESGNYTSEWTGNIGTKRINAAEYSRLVKAAETEGGSTAETSATGASTSTADKAEAVKAVVKPTDNDTVNAVILKAQGKELSGSDVRPILEDAEAVKALESVAGPLDLKGKSSAEQRAIVREAVTKYAAENPVAVASEVKSASKAVPTNVEAVAQKYGRQAAAVRSIYNIAPVENVENFANAFEAAYRIGLEGGLETAAVSSEYTQALSENQRRLAYATGLAVRAAKGITTSTRRGGSGIVRARGMKANDINKRFKKGSNQKTALNVLRTISEATGFTIEVFDSEGDYSMEQGSFDWGDDVIRIDIASGICKAEDVEQFAKYAMLRTFCHEFTHTGEKWAAEEYNILRTAVIEALSANEDFDLDQRIAQIQRMDYEARKAQYMAKGMDEAAAAEKAEKEKLSWDMASREVVAEAMTDVLPESKFMQSLIEKDPNLADKLIDELKKFIARVKGYYRELVSNPSPEAQALKVEVGDTVKYLEGIVEKWDAMALAAVENYKAAELIPGEEGTITNEAGEPVAHSTADGTVQLSLRTYEEDGRDAFRSYLEKCVSSKRLTKAEMQEMMDGIEDIYKVCKEFKDKYAPFSAWSDAEVVKDTYGKPVFSVVTPNGDYKMNLDFSLVCKKRRTLDAVFNEMSKRGIIDDFELGQKSVVKINEIIRKHGFETACALCFVDAKRFRQASMADSFTRLYNELVRSLVPEEQSDSIGRFNFAGYENIKNVENGIDTWDNSKLDFSHLDEVMKNYGKGTVEHKAAKYIKNHPEGRRLLLRGDFMSSQGFDAVKTQNKDILKLYNSKKGTGGPKAAFGDVQYMNEVIKKNKSWTPAKAYAVGGVRIQSFSDYVPRMVFDYVQMIYDLAATKLPAHAYTKEALFVKQFGLTGIKINMSLIPAVDKNGIAAGLDANGNYVWAGESFDFETAKQIQNAEGYSENCGTICVGVSKQHINKLLSDPDIRMVIPYHKSGLNPIVAHMNKIAAFTDYTDSQRTKGADGKALAKDFDFNKALHDMGDEGDPKAVAKQYLDWCAANGYTPKFDDFKGHPNYYKLLEDFTVYDKDGKYVPQREVRAVFPKADNAFGSMKELMAEGLQEDAIIQGKRDSSLSSIVDEIEKSLPKTEAEIEETEVEQADRDVEAETIGQRQYLRRVDNEAMKDLTQDPLYPKTEREMGAFNRKFIDKISGLKPNTTRDIMVITADHFYFVRAYGTRGLNPYIGKIICKTKIAGNEDLINSMRKEISNGTYKPSKEDDLPYEEAQRNGRRNSGRRTSLRERLDAEGYGYLLDDQSDGNTERMRGQSQGDSRGNEIKQYSRRDSDYLDAVNRGDMETAQRMVDEAAKAAGYNEEVFHGMGHRHNIYKSGSGQYGDGVYFTYHKDVGRGYGSVVDHLYVKVGRIANFDDAYKALGKRDDQTLDDFAQTLGFPNFDEMIDDWDNDPTDIASNSELIDILMNKGFEGFVDDGNDGFVLWDFNGIEYRIKSADPVTYDDAGNVIPLSERFNAENPDIRYQRRTQSYTDREVLEMAAEDVGSLKLSEGEKTALDIFNKRLDEVKKLEEQRDEQRRILAELNKAEKPDEAEIRKTKTRLSILGKKIKAAEIKLLDVENKKVLKDVLHAARRVAEQETARSERQNAADRERQLKDYYRAREKKAKLGRDTTAMRHKVQDIVKELDTYLRKGTKDKHVPISLQKAVAAALDVVNMDTVGAEERLKALNEKMAKESDPIKLNDLLASYRRIMEQGDKMSEKLSALKTAYAEIKDSTDPLIANSHDEVIEAKIEAVAQKVGDTPLREMSMEQLQDVYELYKMVLTRTRDANKAHAQNIKVGIAQMGSNAQMEVENVGGKKKVGLKSFGGVNQFLWNNFKPIYAFKAIGSKTLSKLFDNIRAGEDVWAKDISEARAFLLEQRKKHGYDSWDLEETHNFTSTSGLEFKLNLEQMMSIYAYSKRKQADEHLQYGGIVFENAFEKKKLFGKFDIKLKTEDASAYNISPETLAEIISKLEAVPGAKDFVDEMQDYLSSVMGEKGNEVSLAMYDVKLFKEKHYFPLHSSQAYMAKAREQAKGDIKIKNKGFTKETVPHATNPIVLEGFMDVWASHVDEMSMYHAFTLPLEDFYRVYNYKTPSNNPNLPAEGVNPAIINAYGKAATNYIEQMLKDLNGGARTDPAAGIINKPMGKFKKGAVLASASVVVQQPSSVARALALIDAKYFRGKAIDAKKHSELWEELKTYAPVVIIKEMGYFDTNTGKSTVDFLKGREYTTGREKLEALVKDGDYRDELLSKAPALADELAWCQIWQAVKRETAAKYPSIETSSEAFLEVAGKRFTQIVTETQVYDSVLSRSANMRSKDTGMKMATSFLSEPTVALNMLADAIIQGKRGDKAYAGKAIGSIVAAQIINSALAAIVYAGRDDDEDETYAEKYISSFVGGALDSLNPLSWIPFVKDIISIAKGYDVERSDMALVADWWKAYQQLDNDNVSGFRKVEDLVGTTAQFFGLPIKNIMRDARGLFQTFDSFFNGENFTAAGMGYAVKGALFHKDVDNGMQLLEARMKGDEAHEERVMGRFDDEKDANSAVRSAIKESFDDGTLNAEEAVLMLEEYAGMDEDDAYWKVQEWEGKAKAEDDDYSFSRYDDVYDAVLNDGDFDAAMEEMLSHGYKESDVRSQVRGEVGNWYKDDEITRQQAKSMLLEYGDMDSDKAEERLKEWDFKKKYGFSYDDKAEAYADGEISADELRKVLMDMEGYSEEKADEQIEVYDWQNEGYEHVTAARIRDYEKYCEDLDVSKDMYLEIRYKQSNTNNDKDANGKSISYSAVKKIMEFINTFPMTPAQKDAVAKSIGWSDKTIKKYKLW